MTGAEFAVYNGGIDLRGTENAPAFAYTAGSLGDQLTIHQIQNYREVQQYMAVQIPLMMDAEYTLDTVINPVPGEPKKHELSPYQGTGDAVNGYSFLYSEKWIPSPDQYGNNIGMMLRRAEENHSTELEPEEYIDLLYADSDGEINGNGKLRTRLLSPIASIELGFRWKLGRGAGLYTGFYLDANLLDTWSDGSILKEREPQSILNAQGLPNIYVRQGETDPAGTYAPTEIRTDPLPAAARLYGAVHTGLKMKISFGKVKKAPVPVILPPKPDTVVKTVVQTVVVRDTVTQQNTVVVRDTVEKVKVVRDTVIVIKEVPQEIKDVMVELSNTLFAFNKFNLTDKAKEGLNKVAKWLNDNPEVQCEISGHTDSIGSDAYNQKLSEDRAKSVYEYFIHEGGVSSKRLSYKGYGKTRPIATNDTDEGRQQNRRVELNIIQ